jgi:hypothetical protein
MGLDPNVAKAEATAGQGIKAAAVAATARL